MGRRIGLFEERSPYPLAFRRVAQSTPAGDELLAGLDLCSDRGQLAVLGIGHRDARIDRAAHGL